MMDVWKIILRPAFSLTRHYCDVRKDGDQSNHTIVNLFYELCDLIGHYLFGRHSYNLREKAGRKILFDIICFLYYLKLQNKNEETVKLSMIEWTLNYVKNFQISFIDLNAKTLAPRKLNTFVLSRIF